jgi:hypothetical protein
MKKLFAIAVLAALQSAPLHAFDQKGHDARVQQERETRERVARENQVQRQQDAIRERARQGGYETEYDRSVQKYGGPATQKSVDGSRPKNGTGHPGDHSQPGLSGLEGAR